MAALDRFFIANRARLAERRDQVAASPHCGRSDGGGNDGFGYTRNQPACRPASPPGCQAKAARFASGLSARLAGRFGRPLRSSPPPPPGCEATKQTSHFPPHKLSVSSCCAPKWPERAAGNGAVAWTFNFSRNSSGWRVDIGQLSKALCRQGARLIGRPVVSGALARLWPQPAGSSGRASERHPGGRPAT